MRRDVISREDAERRVLSALISLRECRLCNLLRLFTAMFKINRSHGAHSMKRSELTHAPAYIIIIAKSPINNTSSPTEPRTAPHPHGATHKRSKQYSKTRRAQCTSRTLSFSLTT